MRTTSIRELHEQTGQWVRQSSEGEIYIPDRGPLVAKMIPVKPLPQGRSSQIPPIREPFFVIAAPCTVTDATEIISQEREVE
jgi:antitoxin (DNA-binding transcriptional repressor) of toxin-antitoxin stability system